MGEKKNPCKICLKSLEAIVQLGIFICVCILCSLSSKEPFKSHIIGDISNYFHESSKLMIMNAYVIMSLIIILVQKKN